MKTDLEIRLYTGLEMEMRKGADGTVDFRGYGSAYDAWYPVAGGKDAGGWAEMVARGSGSQTLNGKPDVRLLVNHGGLPLARTRSGTMTLEEDGRGLVALAPNLDLRNPKVQEVASAMERGDVDEMSFAFRVVRQEWNDDYTERIIREFDLGVRGSDMSIVTYGANPATVAQIRSAAHIDELRASAATPTMSLDYLRAIATQIRVHN
jgi:HK97 family phage prohead protease